MSSRRLAKAWPNAARLLDTGFQFNVRPGSGGAGGMKCDASQPRPAMASAIGPTACVARRPPATWPSRMATKVAPSTRPVPAISSCGFKCWGRMAYLTGPNRVEWHPIRNTTTSASGSDPIASAAQPNAMKAISESFTRRVIPALSRASATEPAMPENRKKGAMNSPAAVEANNAACLGSAAATS